MRTLSLSSPLPLCDGVVVLDERPPVKGDGLGLSGRLLVNGCGGEDDSEDVITATNQTEGHFGNKIGAAGGWGGGEWGGACVFFFSFPI